MPSPLHCGEVFFIRLRIPYPFCVFANHPPASKGFIFLSVGAPCGDIHTAQRVNGGLQAFLKPDQHATSPSVEVVVIALYGKIS